MDWMTNRGCLGMWGIGDDEGSEKPWGWKVNYKKQERCDQTKWKPELRGENCQNHDTWSCGSTALSFRYLSRYIIPCGFGIDLMFFLDGSQRTLDQRSNTSSFFLMHVDASSCETYGCRSCGDPVGILGDFFLYHLLCSSCQLWQNCSLNLHHL